MQLCDFQQQFIDNLNANAKGFGIYANNRTFRLLKALRNAYPVCERLVGEQYFRAMVNDYLKQYPSRSPNLNDYGFYLAELLLDSPFVKDLPYLIDVMHLEWSVHRLLTGKDESVFDWSTLASVHHDKYDNLILCRPDNSVLLHSLFPIDKIWESNQDDFRGDENVDLGSGAVYLFVGRVGFDIRIQRLTAHQWAILEAIDGKRSLGELQSVLTLKSLPALIKAGYIAKFIL